MHPTPTDSSHINTLELLVRWTSSLVCILSNWKHTDATSLLPFFLLLGTWTCELPSNDPSQFPTKHLQSPDQSLAVGAEYIARVEGSKVAATGLCCGRTVSVNISLGSWVKSHTMYGEDSSGRKVSLLNDESSKKPSRPRLLSYSHKSRSSVSSSMSRDDFNSLSSSSNSVSPGISPSTPQHYQLDSLSALETRSTPSPMTPGYPFDPLEQSKNPSPYYAYHRPPPGQSYPAMPQSQDPVAQPYYHLASHRIHDLEIDSAYSLSRTTLQPLQTRLSYPNPDSAIALSPPLSSITTPIIPPSASSTSTATTPTNASSKPIKKKYPCPHATRYSCRDTFTTSGHAARHGKKHTGEKNILCPTCHKAFTRKDNMKQHERTHKSSRLEAPSPTTSAGKIPASVSRRRLAAPRSRSTSQPLPDHERLSPRQSELALRPTMHRSELSEIIHNATPSMEAGPGRPGVSIRMGSMSSRSDEDGEGESPGLDALATAASEMVDA
ncbi:hypothetical protein MMC22_004098 [Lobaria immixta]|nr:hypothetical protein [Lobaria immixta]